MTIRLIIKLGNLLALIASSIWWCQESGWEPIVVACSLFVTFVVQEIRDSPSGLSTRDVSLFDKFLETLPSDGSIEYIKEQDMEGSIDSTRLEDLRRFRDSWGNAEHEFTNTSLRKKLRKLHSLVCEYMEFYAVNTFSDIHGSSRYFHIQPNMAHYDRAQFHSIVRTLHTMADEIVKTHQALIRAAKKRIAK